MLDVLTKTPYCAIVLGEWCHLKAAYTVTFTALHLVVAHFTLLIEETGLIDRGSCNKCTNLSHFSPLCDCTSTGEVGDLYV